MAARSPPPNLAVFFFALSSRIQHSQVMKCLLALILLISYSSSTTWAWSDQKPFLVVIDPGHGGQDLGAVRENFVESQIVLDIAKKLQKELQSQPNIKAILTRETPRGIALRSRVQMANEKGADLFISLHANTSNSDTVTGMEFYFNSPQAVNHSIADRPEDKQLDNRDVIEKIQNDFAFYDKTERSLQLTRSMLQKFSPTDSKGVIKRAPFLVIDHTSMPAVLIELGFISNRREANKLISDEFQNEISRQLTSAIVEYKEKGDKASLVLDK